MQTPGCREFVYHERYRILELTVECPGIPGSASGWLMPDLGMNLCRLAVNGKNIIDFDELLLETDFSGTPLLYPTPNRVCCSTFVYKKKSYKQYKRGHDITSHGLVYDEPFVVESIRSGQGWAAVSAYIDFTPDKPYFNAFPFPHRLWVEYTLLPGGVRFAYRVKNTGDVEIPYGIALHPYFIKLDGEDNTRIRVPFQFTFLNIEEDLIPTGALTTVQGTHADLTKYRAVGDCDLDHVYTGLLPGQTASVWYFESGLRVTLNASPEFTHMVVYTPPGMPFFCLENQSCSTDAHNLHARGYIREAGLEFAPPHGTAGGWISYLVENAGAESYISKKE